MKANTRTLLVGAEGVAELEGCDWIWEATQEERERVTRQLDGLDRDGRPYWLMTVDLDRAPMEAKKRALRFDKTVRLIQ